MPGILDQLDLSTTSPTPSLLSSNENEDPPTPRSSALQQQHPDHPPLQPPPPPPPPEEEEHKLLEQSMRLQANNRDRRTIRRSSTRLDAHAIRSLQSLQSLQSFKHTSTIAKRKTTTWTTEQTKHDDDENDFNINSTIRSEEDIPSHHRTTKLSNMSKRSSFVRGSVVRSSIVRSMSMIIQPEHSIVESSTPETCMRISYNIFIFILAFWGLFMKDLNTLFLPASADVVVLIGSWCVFGLFTMEVIVFATFLPNYYRSEEMWMETLAALSLLPLGSHLILFSTVDDRLFTSSTSLTSDDTMYNGTELLYMIKIANTLYMILQPIRAAAMANRTAISLSKLLQYSTALVGGVVAEVTAARSPARKEASDNYINPKMPDLFLSDEQNEKMLNESALFINGGGDRDRGTKSVNGTDTQRNTIATTPQETPVSVHSSATANSNSSKTRQRKLSTFAILKPHHTVTRSYSNMLGYATPGSGGNESKHSDGSTNQKHRHRSNSQATTASSGSGKKHNRRRSSLLARLRRTSSTTSIGSMDTYENDESEDDGLSKSMLGMFAWF